MKKKKYNLISLLFFSFVFTTPFVGCSSNQKVVVENKEFITQQYLDFTKGEPNSLVMTASDGYSNEGVFGCCWSKDNVSFDEDGMSLIIHKDESNYYGGEMKTMTPDGLFEYGYFSTLMKPSNVKGTASTFFLYTGDADDQPHDEVDIEFLGKDTTRVQFNYFSNDVGSHEYWYDLGFDASEEFHTYGFYWDLGKIIWYVDNVPVYEAVKDIPTHPMRIYTNFWCGSKDRQDIIGWMGEVKEENLPAITFYKEINYSDINGVGIRVPEASKEEFNDDYVISMYDLGFDSTNEYSVSKKSDCYEVNFTMAEGKYQYLAPIGYAGMKFGNPTYSTIKVKNLSDFSYDFCMSYYNSSGEYVCLDGEVKTENGSSSLRKKGSTCLYYTLGANDTVEFKSTFAEGITKFSKMNIMAAPNSNTSGSFSILDWFIYDTDPVDNSDSTSANKSSLMNYGFGGNYEVTKNGETYDVNYSQSSGALNNLIVNDAGTINPAMPQYSVIKIKNTSTKAFEFIISFKDADNNYLTTGGVVLSSENSTSKYTKHGSTAEYFLLGLNDTAEFKVFLKENIQNYKLIEIIAEPKTSTFVTGSFSILDWYIAE